MSSGKTHDKITVFTTPFVGTLTFLINFSKYSDIKYCLSISLLAAISYWIGGYYFSPDLDIVQSKPTQRWGRLKFIWILYRNLVGRHRSIWSHFPIIGTALRLFYFSLWVSVVIIFWDLLADVNIDFVYIYTNYRFEVMTSVVAIELSAITHYICDIGYSAGRKAFKNQRE